MAGDGSEMGDISIILKATHDLGPSVTSPETCSSTPSAIFFSEIIFQQCWLGAREGEPLLACCLHVELHLPVLSLLTFTFQIDGSCRNETHQTQSPDGIFPNMHLRNRRRPELRSQSQKPVLLVTVPLQANMVKSTQVAAASREKTTRKLLPADAAASSSRDTPLGPMGSDTSGGTRQGRPKRQRQDFKVVASKASKQREERRRKEDKVLQGRIKSINPALTHLQMNKVRPRTQGRYLRSLEAFLAHQPYQKLPEWSSEEWDTEVLSYLENLYDSGEGQAEAKLICAAVLWMCPQLKGPQRAALPKCSVALRGWSRMEPDKTRAPLPYSVMCAMTVWLCREGQHRLRWQSALLLWVMFESYLRISEALALKSEDVIPWAWLDRNRMSPTTIMACSSLRQLLSKTNRHDLSIPLDLPRQRGLAELMLKVAQVRGPGAFLFELTPNCFRIHFKQALQAVGASVLSSVPHCLRHGGASHDVATRSRSLAQVQLRGGWSTVESLKRYEKHGILGRELASLSQHTRQEAHKQIAFLENNYYCLFAKLLKEHVPIVSKVRAAAKSY